MKGKLVLAIGLIGLLSVGCQNNKKRQNNDVVSERYIHKYGYDVPRSEWIANAYPGQVITTLKNGVTVTASYETGLLHGQTTYTYPHSQTLESLYLYEKGNLIKKVSYDVRGMPYREDLHVTDSRIKSKYWYNSGTPRCTEELEGNSLAAGEYFTQKNELESKIDRGAGVRTIRDKHGVLCAKETINNGAVVKRESFYPNGSPHVTVSYKNGIIHGEKKVFAEGGEPLSIENWSNGNLDGICTYFQNGVKYEEIEYREGFKHGVERHYIDGEAIASEIEWLDNQKHGPVTYYSDGISHTEWYYNNQMVTKAKFEELVEREKMISIMSERARTKSNDFYE